MLHNGSKSFFFFGSRWQKEEEGRGGEQREEREVGPPSKLFDSCQFFVFVIPHGTVFVIEMSILMYCRGQGATWNVSHVVLLLQLHCVQVCVLYHWCGLLCIN